MKRRVAALALLLALLVVAPAGAADLQSSSTVDQALDQRSTTSGITFDADRPHHTGSGRCAVFSAAALVHNTGCEMHADQLADALGDGARVFEASPPAGGRAIGKVDLPNARKDGWWASHRYAVDSAGRAWDADTAGMPLNQYQSLFEPWVVHGPVG